MTSPEPIRITWVGRGRRRRIIFGHGIGAKVQFAPMTFNMETVLLPECKSVGLVRAGEFEFRIRPHQTLVIPDHLDPAIWYVI